MRDGEDAEFEGDDEAVGDVEESFVAAEVEDEERGGGTALKLFKIAVVLEFALALAFARLRATA